MRSVIHSIALIAAAAGLGACAAVAHAGTFICVPAAAGAGVTSGGSSGSCASGTPVELPSARADQQTMLSVLPYMSFKASGIGGKPTITVTGANVQVVKRADTGETIADGTGNLVLGRANNPYSRERTGSDNLVVGDAHGWTGQNALLAGFDNQARGFWNVAFGQDGLVSGNAASVLGGYGNTAAGLRSSVLGGNNKTASGTGQVIAADEGARSFSVSIPPFTIGKVVYDSHGVKLVIDCEAGVYLRILAGNQQPVILGEAALGDLGDHDPMYAFSPSVLYDGQVQGELQWDGIARSQDSDALWSYKVVATQPTSSSGCKAYGVVTPAT